MKKFPSVTKDKESGLPKKYVAGLSTSTAKARAAHWKKMEKYSDKDPRAYKPAPGDATAKTKPSKYTKRFHKMFGEQIGIVIEGAPEKIEGTNCANCIHWVKESEKPVDKSELNEFGGLKSPNEAYVEMAKHVDLVTLPGKANVKIKAYCNHEDIHDFVTERMCCAYWDNEDAKREFKGVSPKMDESKNFFSDSKFGDDEGNTFSVEKIIAYAKKNPKYFQKDFPLSKIKHDLSWWQGNKERMMNADTSYPLLVIQNNDGHLSVADGLNRMKKAIDVENKETIDVYLVPKKDIMQFAEKQTANESIVKVDGKFRLVSKKTGRNLGTYDTKAGAMKRERQVQYFKSLGETMKNESRIAGVLAAMNKARPEPKVGDRVVTIQGGQNTGTVEKIKDNHVYFRSDHSRPSLGGGSHKPLYKTHISNVRLHEEKKVSFGRSGGVMHYNPKTEKSEKDGSAKLYDPEKHDKKLSPKGGFAVKKEEVEQIDELSPFSKLGGRLFRAKQTLGMYRDVVKSGVNLVKGANAEKTDKRGFVTNRNHPDVKKHFDAAKKNTDSFKRRANAIARTVQQKNPGKAAAIRKLTTNEEVELDEAQKKLKPSYWRAEWRLGTQTEVDKNNKKIYDKLAKTDPVKAKAFHNNLMKLRKEEVEQTREGFLDFVKKKKPVNKPKATGAEMRAFFSNLERKTKIADPQRRGSVYHVHQVAVEEVNLDERIDVNKQKKNAVLRQAGVNAAIGGKVPFAGSALQMGRKAAKKLPSKTLAKSYRELPRVAEEAIEEGKADTSLAAKAKKSGVSLGTLRKVYNRGVAAWNSGHRPGTTPQQWGHARVNSYITKGKTYHTADKDLRRESVDFNEAFKEEFNDEIE